MSLCHYFEVAPMTGVEMWTLLIRLIGDSLIRILLLVFVSSSDLFHHLLIRHLRPRRALPERLSPASARTLEREQAQLPGIL